MPELDAVSRQILEALSRDEKNMTDLERHADAARQTVLNRVNDLVAHGYVKERREKFPPTRLLSLTEAGKKELRRLQIVSSVSTPEQLEALVSRASLFQTDRPGSVLTSRERLEKLFTLSFARKDYAEAKKFAQKMKAECRFEADKYGEKLLANIVNAYSLYLMKHPDAPSFLFFSYDPETERVSDDTVEEKGKAAERDQSSDERRAG